jgi:RNA polymerase sigma factor (sigma-70 family)
METDLEHARRAVRDALGSQRERWLALVRRRAGGRADAEELLQVAAQRALERVHQLRDPERAEAWTARIVRNVVADALRDRPVHELSSDDIAAVDEQTLDCDCVLAQTAQLKPEYAYVLRRVVVDGVRITDLAAELGVSANNATVRLHRARAALRTRLERHCGTTDARACADCGCGERGCCPAP